jgi:excisionase family DNA binding protein
VHTIELDLGNSRSDRQRTSHSALTRLAYSPSEGAQVLGISRSKIYELIAAGDLKVIKLGSRTLILHSELVRFLASRARTCRDRREEADSSQPRPRDLCP